MVRECPRTGSLYESIIRNVIFETSSIAFDERAIGKTIFLSHSEAEAALASGAEEGGHEKA